MKTILEYLVNNHIKTNNIEHLVGSYEFFGVYKYLVYRNESNEWVKINAKINNDITLNLFYAPESSFIYYVNPQNTKKWGGFTPKSTDANKTKEIIDAICEKPEDFYKIINANHGKLFIIPEFENVQQNLL